MAVCNLFNDLTKNTGNFLMFQQYVDDLTQYMSKNSQYKVIPSKFIVCDINYAKEFTLPAGDLNHTIPLFFQDYIENGVAYCKNHKAELSLEKNNIDIFKSIFWDGLINQSKILDIQNEIRYIGDINIQSYNEHAGMGYSEIYCYIPSNESQYKYDYILSDNAESIQNSSTNLEGYETPIDASISKNYYFNKTFEINNKQLVESDKYEFNTIIVLYDIYLNENEVPEFTNIPMGIYFTGNFEGTRISNSVTKFVTNKDIYDSGTSYGLRICNRFTVSPNSDTINTTDVELTNDNYAAFCQAMTESVKCLNEMKEINEKSINQYQFFKDTLSEIKNDKVNVPYIRQIGDKSYWFVNGKLVSQNPNIGFPGGSGSDCNCAPYPPGFVEDEQDLKDLITSILNKAQGGIIPDNYYTKSDADRLFQPRLYSGTNIKKINEQDILGEGSLYINNDSQSNPDINYDLIYKHIDKVINDKMNDLYSILETNKADIDKQLTAKQNTLISGTNIKTINEQDILGGGNISITSSGESGGSCSCAPYDDETINNTFNDEPSISEADILNMMQ